MHLKNLSIKLSISVILFSTTVGIASAASMTTKSLSTSTNGILLSPSEDLQDLQQSFNQLINYLDKAMNTRLSPGTYNPDFSLEETKLAYIVRVDLPGVDKEKINIELKNNLLTISGEKKAIREGTSSDKFYVSESSYGAFKRTITLPKDIDDSNLTALYDKGVLKITVPRKIERDSATTKKIIVK